MAVFYCTECGRKVHRKNSTWKGKPCDTLCRNCKCSKTGKVYYSTPLGKATRAWNNLNSRVRRQKSYEGVKVNITQEEFTEWYIKTVAVFEKEHPNQKPSVDRKREDGHYELSNLQIMEVQENRIKNSHIKNIGGKAPAGTKWCPGCEQYRAIERFYHTTNNRTSHRCRKCLYRAYRSKWEKKHGRKLGVCVECKSKLPRSPMKKISFAKHCANCRSRLWRNKNK